jgi:hypothetical protein
VRPVKQTQFYPGVKDAETGNCFAACIASILELDISEVPNFAAIPGDEWWTDFIQFMVDRGLQPIYWERPEGMPASEWAPPELPGCYTILTGMGGRGVRHSCVGLSNEVVHDPLPEGDGKIELDEMIAFVAADPAQYAKREAASA